MKRGSARLPIGLFALTLAVQPVLSTQPSFALRQGTLSPIPASSLLKRPAPTKPGAAKPKTTTPRQNAARKPAPLSADDLLKDKRNAEAEAAFRQIIQKVGANHIADSEKLINAYLGLAVIYAPQNTSEAIRFYEQAIDLAEVPGTSEATRDRVRQTLPELHQMVTDRRQLPSNSRAINAPLRISLPDATNLLGTEDATQIEVALKSIWNHVNQTYKKRSAAHVNAALSLVNLYMQQHRFGEAQTLLAQVDETYPKLSAAEQSYCVRRMLDMSLQFSHLQRFIESEQLYTPVLKGAKFTDSSLRVNESLSQLVDSLVSHQRFAQAENIERALLSKDDISDPEILTEHRLKLARILRLTRHFGAAEELYKMAIESQEKAFGNNDPRTISTLVQMANLYIAMQRNEQLTETVNKLQLAVSTLVQRDNQTEPWRELQELAPKLASYGQTEAGVKLLQTILSNATTKRRHFDYEVQQAVQRTANAAAQAGDLESAEQLYTYAIKQAADDTERGINEVYTSQLITLLFDNKRDDRACAVAEEYLTKFKSQKNVPMYQARTIAQTLDRFKQYAGAVAIWKAIIDKQYDSTPDQRYELAELLNSCARSMVAANDTAGAESMLKRLIGMVTAKNAEVGQMLLTILTEYKSANRLSDCNRLGDDVVHSHYLRTNEDSELLIRIASHFQALGHADRVDATFQQALKSAEKAYGNDSHQISNLRNRYANILRVMNRHAEAAELEKNQLYSTSPHIRRP
jgi:tetratricopeptide (TPR) repeat protein